jgi:hypothetical protein
MSNTFSFFPQLFSATSKICLPPGISGTVISISDLKTLLPGAILKAV